MLPNKLHIPYLTLKRQQKNETKYVVCLSHRLHIFANVNDYLK